jgi:hypothetical protein
MAMTTQTPFKWCHFEPEVILLCVRYHALMSPRKAEEIARDTGVSGTSVRRVISSYNRVATSRD